MKKINFYIGIWPISEHHFWDTIHNLNEGDSDSKFEAVVVSKNDNPDGHLTFTVRGTKDAYNCFLTDPYVKSIEQFKE